jgi:molybdopterin converting factor small subunit
MTPNRMVHVELNLYATLRCHIGGATSVKCEIEAGETIRQMLERLGVPPEQTRIIFVNNRSADLSYALEGGERVAIFPAIGGG